MVDETSSLYSNAGYELQQLLLSTNDVVEYLERVAGYAVRTVVADADLSCGITLQRHNQPLTVASSDPRAVSVDEVQYQIDRGPCLHSMRTGEVVLIDDLATDEAWVTYRMYGIAAGVRSSLSLPIAADGIQGAMNMYAPKPGTFDQDAIDRAQALAREAAHGVALAMRMAQQAELSEQLQAALSSRAVIDQAMGVIMGQNRCSADAAFNILRAASQHRNIKLRDVAADIVRAVSGDDSVASGDLAVPSPEADD
jgi:GAF domain-containing protein